MQRVKSGTTAKKSKLGSEEVVAFAHFESGQEDRAKSPDDTVRKWRVCIPTSRCVVNEDDGDSEVLEL